VSTRVLDNTLVDDSREVLETFAPKEEQVETKDGDCYLARIMPYGTIDNVIDGAVVTFPNISAFVHTIASLKRPKTKLEQVKDDLKRMLSDATK